MLRSFLLLLSVLPLVACASTGSGGRALRVALVDFQGGQRFALASESHTDRVEYYSSVRRDASLKVQTDEVMAALVDEFDRLGWSTYAQPGRGPSRGGRAISRSLEVERDGAVQHWVVGDGSELDERRHFAEAMTTFFQLYNITQAFQAIENQEGAELFDERRADLQRTRPAR